MALFENENGDLLEIVKWGNYSDCCLICLREKMEEEKIGNVQARKELTGKLLDKKVIKIRHSGTDVVVCKEHWQKAIDKLNSKGKEAATSLAEYVKNGDDLTNTEPPQETQTTQEVPEAPEAGSKRGRKHAEDKK